MESIEDISRFRYENALIDPFHDRSFDVDPFVGDVRVKHALIKGQKISPCYFLRWHSQATKMSKQEVVDRKPLVRTDVIPLFDKTKLEDRFLGDAWPRP